MAPVPPEAAVIELNAAAVAPKQIDWFAPMAPAEKLPLIVAMTGTLKVETQPVLVFLASAKKVVVLLSTPVVKLNTPAPRAAPPVEAANQSMVVPAAGVTVPESVTEPGPVLTAPVTVAITGKLFTVPLIAKFWVVAPVELKTKLPVTVPVLPAAILI